MAQRLVIILINPAVHLIPAKAAVPAEHTLVLMVAAEQELVALPARLLPAEVVLQAEDLALPDILGKEQTTTGVTLVGNFLKMYILLFLMNIA